MVGGIVVGLARGSDYTAVEVADCPHSPRHRECPLPDRCSVRTVERCLRTGVAVEIMIGDSLWWNCGKCYWTGAGAVRQDVPLVKIGYSYQCT